MKGVNSFSGYVTYMLEEMMQKDKTFAKYAPKIEKISIDDDRIILKIISKIELPKLQFRKENCIVSYVMKKIVSMLDMFWSIPDVYEVLNARGIKHPIIVEEVGFEPTNSERQDHPLFDLKSCMSKSTECLLWPGLITPPK